MDNNEAIQRLKEMQLPPHLDYYNRPTQEEVEREQQEVGEDYIVTKGCGKFIIHPKIK